MIYVLLDTNIIIDMVVDRRNNVNDNLLKTFIKLLDCGEVNLILPAVVKTETFRHLDSELDEVGKKIDKTMDAINSLYGVSTYDIDPLDLTEYKKSAREELHKAQELYQKHKNDYSKDIGRTINLLFSHNNTIFIDDEPLMAKIQKRRVHKRAPFHKESKESYGDGAIIETLISLGNRFQLEAEDKIYFVTGNYEDFSESKTKKDELHPDIIEDLKAEGLDLKVIYVRSFANLIHPHLEVSIEHADLIEEFEAELKENEESYYQDMDDIQRESAGLTPLGSFSGLIEDNIIESQFALDVIDQFNRLNDAYRELEKLSLFFEDELKVEHLGCKELISIFSEIVGCSDEIIVENITNILDWIEEQKYECRIIDENMPDFLNLDEDITFRDIHRKTYAFSIRGIDYLTPANGGTDTIEVQIKDGRSTIASGYIDIAYGFIEDDPFDGIGDGCEESIDYNTETIVKKLSEICDEWESFIETKAQIVEKIKSALE